MGLSEEFELATRKKRLAGCMDQCRWHSDMLHISETEPSQPCDSSYLCHAKGPGGSCNHSWTTSWLHGNSGVETYGLAGADKGALLANSSCHSRQADIQTSCRGLSRLSRFPRFPFLLVVPYRYPCCAAVCAGLRAGTQRFHGSNADRSTLLGAQHVRVLGGS